MKVPLLHSLPTALILAAGLSFGIADSLAAANQRTQLIPEGSGNSPVQFNEHINSWSINGKSPYGFIQLEAQLDSSENALIYIGAVNDHSFTIETRYNSIDDKVSILGYCEDIGYLYLEIVFINDLRIASMSGTLADKSIALEQENMNKELHWAYVTSTMLASVLDLN